MLIKETQQFSPWTNHFLYKLHLQYNSPSPRGTRSFFLACGDWVRQGCFGVYCTCTFFATDAVSTHIWTVWHHLIYIKLLFFKTMLFVGILPWHGLHNVTLYTCICSPVSSVMTQEWRIWAMINSGSSKNAIFQCWLSEYQYGLQNNKIGNSIIL